MPDEVPNEQLQEQPAEVPASPPEAPPEPLDPSGVPYKNRVAEYERKLNEASALNQQYQQVLGQYANQQQAARPAAEPEDPDEAKLDPVSRGIVYKIAEKVARKQAQQIAEQTGYRFVQQAEHQNIVSGDPELYEEAKRQYATFKQHPMWSGVDDTLVQDRAIAQARAVMGEKRRQTATNAGVQNAARASAGAAGVPPTRPAGSAAPTTDRQKWIAQYVVQPETRQMFKMIEGHHYDPNNEQDRHKMLNNDLKKDVLGYAEQAWQGTKFTGAVGKAVQALQSGAGTEVQIEEV